MRDAGRSSRPAPDIASANNSVKAQQVVRCIPERRVPFANRLKKFPLLPFDFPRNHCQERPSGCRKVEGVLTPISLIWPALKMLLMLQPVNRQHYDRRLCTEQAGDTDLMNTGVGGDDCEN